MDNTEPINPYNDDPTLAAFAGREDAFIRLHQHLTNPTNAEAIVFMGRNRAGKTALLLRADSYFDETFIHVYVALRQVSLDSESAWLLIVVRAINRALAERDFTLSRLPDTAEASENVREWLSTSYLPELFSVIRHRRLVLLIDDVQVLIEAITSDKLPADIFAYLQALLRQHAQLGIVLTLNSGYESQIEMLYPLVNANEVVRLSNLAPNESAWLLQQPARQLYNVPDESADIIHRATGGQPQLLQRAGNQLFERWQAHPDQVTMSREDTRQILTQVYMVSEGGFKQTWQETSRGERLVLTAISGLLYNDPLHSIDAAGIEGWLVETDYPMDLTAINAALRSLEYREVVGGLQGGVTIAAGLMQTWLLENARLGDKPGMVEAVLPASRSRWVVVLIVVAIALGILLAISLSRAPQPGTRANDTPVPTVTLATDE